MSSPIIIPLFIKVIYIMKFLSLFSGIEAASVAWKPLGWECVGFSEIEPFPCSLLAHHYPDVPNLGDITKITEQQIADLGDFDVLVFGSPCQDLSVAGTRKGLQDGTRSNLFYEALRIFDYARKHNTCRFVLWENVPGAFSSNKGADFAAVVREMAGLQDVPVPPHGWGNSGVALGENGLLEWRVLDAQYFGLAQRRKRVFAILDTGNWEDRPPILFERESLSGDTPPSREKGCETTTTAGTSLTTSSGQALAFQSSYNNVAVKDNITPPILAAQGTTGNKGVYVCHGSQHPISNNSELANCLGTNNGMENAIAYTIHADPTPKISADVAGTLRSQGGGGIVPPNMVYGFDSKQQNASATEEMTPTLVASGYKEPLGVITGNIIGRDNANGGNQVGIYESETSPTLTTSDRHAVIYNYVVRRLTPTECERLMGFPDGYTDVPHNGKPASNSARYKALGNSMATNVMQYIGRQIQNAVNFNQQESTKMITQSPTSLQTFLTCPRQYEAKYITKEVKFEQNDHATFGDLVHKSIEAYLKHGEPLPTVIQRLQTTLDTMGQVLFGAETKLAVDKNNNPVEFFDKEAYQRCIVDAILTNHDQSVVVCIDWKTGKKRDAQTQHDFIKKCAKAKFPNAKIVTLFVYLFAGDSDRQEYNGQPLVKLDTDMNNLQIAYANNSFKPTPSGLCGKWCDVTNCKFNGRAK